MRNIQRIEAMTFVDKLSVAQMAWALVHTEKWLVRDVSQNLTPDFNRIPGSNHITRITGPVISRKTMIVTPEMSCNTCLYSMHGFCGRPLWMSRHKCKLNTTDYSFTAWLLRFLEKRACYDLEYIITQTIAVKQGNCFFLTKGRGCLGWTLDIK